LAAPALDLAYIPATARRPDNRPTCIDLFAGAGGLAEGFRQAGFSILSGTDCDPFAAETFSSNFPEASFFLCPVSALTGEELLRDAGLRPGQLDCLIGGPPCTAFSYNNHQRSTTHIRAGLFRDYLRIVGVLRPKCLVMENVPGILTIGNGAIVEEIYGALEDLGYECEARILYAEEFGVPQERRRVFFIATRLGWSGRLFPPGTHGPVPKPSLAANQYVHRWGERRRRVRLPSVWTAIGDLPRLQNGGSKHGVRHTRKPRTGYQRRMRGRTKLVYNHTAPILSAANLERMRHVPPGGNWRDIPFELLPAGMRRARKKDHSKRYGRLSKRGRCCTILTKCDPHWGSYIHPVDERAISVREAARLQGFPDRFQFTGPRSLQFIQVGNAVPPPLAFAIGRAVGRHLRKHRRTR
jgi:DNA (cytosine-5)-methyltransferase 1